MSDLFEIVENIVVKVIADTGGFVRNEHYTEPDSRVVTREIILKVADVMDQDARAFGLTTEAGDWLRSQAPGSGETK